MELIIESFGFRNGVPKGASVIFDARIIRNPEAEFSHGMTGLDDEIRVAVLEHRMAPVLLRYMDDTVDQRLRERKKMFHLGIGCIGGHHRSVAMAEALAQHYKYAQFDVRVIHRDIDKWGKSGCEFHGSSTCT